MNATRQTQCPTPVQPSPVNFPRIRRSLVPLNFVQLLNGIGEDGALALVESGQIPFAWNIAHGRKVREIRVLADDALAVSVDRPCSTRTLEEAIALILPRPTKAGGIETIGASTVRRCFLCGQALIACHIYSKTFRLASPRRTNGTHVLLYSTVVDFLRARLITA